GVFPEPVGAWISVCSPVAIAGQPSRCAGVGSAKAWSNHARVSGLKGASGSTPSSLVTRAPAPVAAGARAQNDDLLLVGEDDLRQLVQAGRRARPGVESGVGEDDRGLAACRILGHLEQIEQLAVLSANTSRALGADCTDA